MLSNTLRAPRRRIASLALLVALAWAPSAHADEPPPSGQRYVSYGFVVDNLAAFPDYVVIAYPWSRSNGAPTREYTEVQDGARVRVGRRSDQPVLYAMKRGAYEAWKRSHAPTGEDDENPELDKLVAGPDVVRCDANLRVRHVVRARSGAEQIEDRYRAVKIDGATCNLRHVKSDPPPSASGSDCAVARPRGAAPWCLLLALWITRRRRARR